MGRTKITLPEKSIASFMIPVRITDINYANHLGNNAIIAIVHEARMQFLTQYGFTELDAGGTGLIMSELIVEFKNESYYPDLLTVNIFTGEISKKSFELFYLISAVRKEKDLIIAVAKTGMVCYNYQRKKIDLLPEKLKLVLLKSGN